MNKRVHLGKLSLEGRESEAPLPEQKMLVREGNLDEERRLYFPLEEKKIRALEESSLEGEVGDGKWEQKLKLAIAVVLAAHSRIEEKWD